MDEFFNIDELINYLDQKREEGYNFVKFKNSHNEISNVNNLGVFLKEDLNSDEQTFNVGDIDYVRNK